ncbi:MAG: Ldh family oxidoreductase [Phycisphaerae bacterium]|nr:Ldh family oxidoreductase [Phycisphaerae bacterium]
MAEQKNPIRVSASDLSAFCVQALMEAGMGRDAAEITTKVLVTTDLMGVSTHGVRNLHNYLKRIATKGLDPHARPEIVSEGPGWAIVDGHNGMAMPSAYLAMQTAIDKAGQVGIAYAGARNSCHFGAAGFYALMAAEEGMIGLSMSNDIPSMTAPGARSHITGTNPLAVAIPAGEEKPILLDVAMSTVAGSKIYQALARGKGIPDNWIVDGEGIPTTDTSVYPHSASLLPMAGHKGYGLALMIETLSALVSGANCLTEVGSWLFDKTERPTGHGHAFIAINVGVIAPMDVYRRRADDMIRSIRRAPKAKGSERIYLPGEMEWDKRVDYEANGIPLTEDIIKSLTEIAETYGLDLGEVNSELANR